MSLPLDAQLEALLFWKAEPVSIKKLAALIDNDEAAVKDALKNLEERLKGRGLSLMTSGDEVTLSTSPDMGPIIENLIKEERSKDLGKAGLETLTIILYQGPISRAEIDYIRGVNSQFIIRNLLVRGLIEKVENPKDQRSYLYKATFDLLAHLGISKQEDMKDFDIIRSEIAAFSASETSHTTASSESEPHKTTS